MGQLKQAEAAVDQRYVLVQQLRTLVQQAGWEDETFLDVLLRQMEEHGDTESVLHAAIEIAEDECAAEDDEDDGDDWDDEETH